MRYQVFIFARCYPGGGIDDLVDVSQFLPDEERLKALILDQADIDFLDREGGYQVYDMKNLKVVSSGGWSIEKVNDINEVILTKYD